MDQGQTVYRGHAFLSTTGEPLHYIQQGTVTGIEAHGAVLVRIGRAAAYGGDQYVPADGWHADGRLALADARRQLEEVEQRFMEQMVAAKAQIAERLDLLDNAGIAAEVQA